MRWQLRFPPAGTIPAEHHAPTCLDIALENRSISARTACRNILPMRAGAARAPSLFGPAKRPCDQHRRDGKAAEAASFTSVTTTVLKLMSPRRTRRRNCAPLATLCLVSVLASAITRCSVSEAGALSVWERKIGDETAVVVSNDHYELIIRPQVGATMSSLRFGAGERMEVTDWVPGAPSGVLQEVHTANFPY